MIDSLYYGLPEKTFETLSSLTLRVPAQRVTVSSSFLRSRRAQGSRLLTPWAFVSLDIARSLLCWKINRLFIIHFMSARPATYIQSLQWLIEKNSVTFRPHLHTLRNMWGVLHKNDRKMTDVLWYIRNLLLLPTWHGGSIDLEKLGCASTSGSHGRSLLLWLQEC